MLNFCKQKNENYIENYFYPKSLQQLKIWILYSACVVLEKQNPMHNQCSHSGEQLVSGGFVCEGTWYSLTNPLLCMCRIQTLTHPSYRATDQVSVQCS